MTKDEIKQQFKRCATLHEECGTIRRRIEDKREDMHYLRAVVTSGTYSRSSNISDKVEHVIELMDGLIHHYAEMLAEREQAEQRVLDMLRYVQKPEYIEKMPPEEISQRLHISERSVWNYVNAAMEQIAAYYPSEGSGASLLTE